MHAHILPGIDDGAVDTETSLMLIRGLIDLGYKRLYATPHVMADLYPNTRDLILKKRDELFQAIDHAGIVLDCFGAAAEYMLDENFMALIGKEPLLTLPGNRVLVEMSSYQPSPALHQVLFDLQMKGYKPVLAHPERYRYYHSAEDFENLKQLGCEFQTNILSLTGHYNKAIQAAARILLKNKLIDFLGTDLHHARHLENLRNALSHKSVIEATSHNLKNREL